MINLEIINYGNDVEETIALKAFVSQPIEKLRYSKYLDDRSVAIEYIDSEEINSKDNLYIKDLSWKIPENNKNFLNLNEEITLVNGNFFHEAKEVLITNKISLDVQNNEVPIYYRHKRKVKEASVHCVKLGDNYDVEAGFLIEDNILYTNYTNYFEESTGKYNLYFVSGVDLQGAAFNELLNLIPVFKEASWEDVDLESGELAENTYTQTSDGLGYLYNINYNTTKCRETTTTSENFFVKVVEQNLIKILPPETYSLNNDWVVRIQDGRIVSNNKTYKVPEYKNQPFNPTYGLIAFRNKQCFKVNSNVIKLPVNKIKVDLENLTNVSVYIRDSEENVLKVVTTNKGLVGKRYSDSEVLYEYGIVSWDERKGLIELDFTVSNTQVITADFHYFADSYLYKEVSLNPFFNEDVVYNRYFFYLKPNENDKSVYYLILNEDNRIVEALDPQLKLETSDKTYNTSTYIGKSLDEFITAYCYGNNNIHDYMQLGEISLKEDFYLDEINHFDVSKRQYTNEKNYINLLSRQWKILQSEFGYGELGQVVQKNNILYIEAPATLLNSMTEEEVERSIRINLPATVDIIVDYTYPESKIEFDTSSAGQLGLTLSWEDKGSYKLYRSESKLAPNISDSEVTPLTTINTSQEEALNYTDTTVESNKRYYYWVRINEHLLSKPHGVRVR